MKRKILIVLANDKLKNDVCELLALKIQKNYINLDGVFIDNLASNRLLKNNPSEYYEILKEETIISLKELNNGVVSLNKNLLTELFMEELKSEHLELKIVFVEIPKKDFIKNFNGDKADLEMELLTYDEMNNFYKQNCEIYIKAKKFDKEQIVLDIIKQIK